MKYKFPAVVGAVAVVLAFAAGLPAQRERHDDNAPPARTITLTAKNFQFIPAVIHVKAGEKVRFFVTSVDVTLGLRINPFPDGATGGTPPGLYLLFGEDCWKLRKNETLPIDVIGETPGTYSYTCCKGCGKEHKGMRGQLIVDP